MLRVRPGDVDDDATLIDRSIEDGVEATAAVGVWRMEGARLILVDFAVKSDGWRLARGVAGVAGAMVEEEQEQEGEEEEEADCCSVVFSSWSRFSSAGRSSSSSSWLLFA
jgi:hypothetical protein